MVRCINTTPIAITFNTPTLEVEEIEEISRVPGNFSSTSGTTAQVNSISTELPAERIKKILDLIDLSHLNAEEAEHVHDLVKENHDVFHLQGEYLGKTNLLQHEIPLTDQAPVFIKQYRYPPIHKEEINKQMKELLENDIIRPSTSPYNAPLWIVPKKPDQHGQKRWRIVIDFRGLNEKSVGDAFPIPNIVEILDQLGSAKYFSVFDCKSGFHQVGMSEKDASKTAFSTPYGHYEFIRMPFGLKNAPATYQRLMNAVLTGLQGTEVFAYIDDIVSHARSLSEHRERFTRLARRLREANLKLEPTKCSFLNREVAYLGHVIGSEGVKPCADKISAVKNFPIPKTVKNVREFLGLAGYYRRFIDKFSQISKPLTNLLKKSERFVWGIDQERAFHALCNALCTEPVLQYPNFEELFHITTDASCYAIGAILSQGEIGKDKPIAYASRLLQGAELNYSTIEKECLAIIYATNHFRPYVYGRKFDLITDHRPLVWMTSVRDPTSRLLRWRLKLAEYDYKIVYKAGKMNVNADALSRNPASVLPINSDSSSELLYSPNNPTPDPITTITPTQTPLSSPSTSSNVPVNITPPTMMESTPPTTDAHDETDDSLELFENPAERPNELRRTFIQTRDRLTMRKDNLAIFVSLDGQPLDQGGVDLALQNKLPSIHDAVIGRAKVSKIGNFNLILLPVKELKTHATAPADIMECFRSLLDVTSELNLNSFSISRGCVDEVTWPFIQRILIDIFSPTNTQIFACSHDVRIPSETEREDILLENHVSAFAGHKGISKTYRRIRERYFWPTLKSDVQKLVNSCTSCQMKKLTRVKTRQPMTLTDTPGQAFDKVSLDIVGPLPTTPKGNKYVLTIQDLLTKYSLAIPLQNATAIDTADAFVNDFICHFGAPKAILTDQGTNFVSSLMKSVARKFRIAQFRATAFHPQSNGSIERSHHVLTEYLKHYISNDNWDDWLKLAMFSYNTSVHEGTRFTPHELVFGKLARMPSANAPLTETPDESYNQYLRELQFKITSTISDARENLIQAKGRSKKYYDKRTNAAKFHVGDKVYLLKEPRKGKFDDEYIGPYLITEVLSHENVKISIRNKYKIVHVNKLKHVKAEASVHVIELHQPPLPQKPGHEDMGTTQAIQFRANHEASNMHPQSYITLCLVIRLSSALIGYDCNGPTLNVTTFSTVDSLECEPEDIQPTTENKEIQLLQLGDFTETPIIQCRIEIDRTVYYCGMHSHVSIVHNGRQQYIQAVSSDTCKHLQNMGSIAITPAALINGVRPNSTTHFSLTLAGSIGPEGSCAGTTYADPYGSWTNVVVQAIVKISLRSYTTAVKLAANEIILQSGQRCQLQQSNCLDSEDGYTFWDPLPTDYCNFNRYDILFEGKATKISTPKQDGPTIYTVTTEETTFALTETHRITLCGYTLIKTEHPKLFIIETATSGRFKSASRTPVNNLDIFTYVNSKFVYVEKHIKNQLTKLYHDIIEQKCALEKQIVSNALALVHISPEEVALTITKEPGYMAIASGEVVHIIKCIPVVCQTRRTEECFDQLPVSYRNSSYFLTPKHRILTSIGTRRECNSVIPTQYKLHGAWYKLMPNPVETVPPQNIQPIAKSTWKYIDPQNLANGGIYSSEDLNKLRNHIMFPVERASVINSIAQGATGQQFAQGSLHMANLFDEEAINKIAESAGQKLWAGFIKFGSLSAGVIGVYITFRFIKMIINTILNGIALHAAYGWSLRLLVAAWSSLAHFCIFLKQQRQEQPVSSAECIPQPQPQPQPEPETQQPPKSETTLEERLENALFHAKYNQDSNI